MSGPGMPPALPPELAALMGAGGAPGGPGMPEAMGPGASAGSEAVAQSDIAKQGLECWKKVQSMNGQRPEGDDVKCLIMYVLTEGMSAPEAPQIAAYLQSLGVQIPGVGPDSVGNDSPIPSAAGPKMSIDDAEPET